MANRAEGAAGAGAGLSVSGLARPTPLSALCCRIVSYAWLPANWGGYGEDPISGEAIADALRFLSLLRPAIPLPDVGPSGDEINFTWEGDEHLIDVGLCGDGKIHYYARIPALRMDRADSPRLPTSRLPRELGNALEALPPADD